MKFRYSFQKIVDLKTNEKTQAEWILSDAVVQLREEEENLSLLFTEKEGLSHQLAASTSSRITASELMSYQYYMNHLDERIKRKRQDIQYAESKVEEKREVLSGKMKEEKVWNQARDKAYQVYQTLVLKKEQEMLDELATTRQRVNSGLGESLLG